MKIVPTIASTGAVALLLGLTACGDDDDSRDDGMSAEFATPASGDEVSSPVEVEMTAEGIEIVEAAEPVDGEGHFHLIVDEGCVEVGEVIPDDDAHHHFGDASHSAQIDLEPGDYSLCLQVGDGVHTGLDATDEIEITVVD